MLKGIRNTSALSLAFISNRQYNFGSIYLCQMPIKTMELIYISISRQNNIANVSRRINTMLNMNLLKQ